MEALASLKQKLKLRLAMPLPGNDAQLQMSHTERRIWMNKFTIPDNRKEGAVLILFFPHEGKIKFPLIVRNEYDGVHSGQVALPGGKKELQDADLAATSLRETQEEIGIDPSNISLLGKMTQLYIPPSNFLVTPYIGIAHDTPVFNPDPSEVAEIFFVEADDLINEKFVDTRDIKVSSGTLLQSPVFTFHNKTIWGATAMMLSELKIIFKEIYFD